MLYKNIKAATLYFKPLLLGYSLDISVDFKCSPNTCIASVFIAFQNENINQQSSRIFSDIPEQNRQVF